MAKISQLPRLAAGLANGYEMVPVVKDGVTMGSTVADVVAPAAKPYADRAAASAAAAEALVGPTYDSVVAGLMDTSDGQSFAVRNFDGTVSIYQNKAGAAVHQRTLSSPEALASQIPGQGRDLLGMPSVEQFFASSPTPRGVGAKWHYGDFGEFAVKECAPDATDFDFEVGSVRFQVDRFARLPLRMLPGADPTGQTSSQAALELALAILKRFPAGAELVVEGRFLIDKLTIHDRLRIVSVGPNSGFEWREQALTGSASAGAALVEGSDAVILSGDRVAEFAIGKIFRRGNTSAVYVIAASAFDGTQTNIKLSRPYLEETAVGAGVETHDAYGMVEIEAGPVTNVDVDCLFDGKASNRGGFMVYAAARLGAGRDDGGLWEAKFHGSSFVNCFNGWWLRGTVGSDPTSSKFPIQFIDADRLTIRRVDGSFGIGMMLSGQVNQLTFKNIYLGKLNAANHTGINVLMTRSPEGVGLAGASHKSPQGIVFGPMATIQIAKYGILTYAGEQLKLYEPYLEHLDRVFEFNGYNSTNKLKVTIEDPRYLGSLGLMADAVNGHLVKAGPNSVIVQNGGVYKGGTANPFWKDAGGSFDFQEPPVLVPGTGGFTDAWTDRMCPSLATSGGVLNTGRKTVFEVSTVTAIDTITSDFPPGRVLYGIVTNVNGLIFTNAGNLFLPNGRARYRLRRGEAFMAIRSDGATYTKFIITPLRKPAVIVRGSNFTLDETFLEAEVRVSGNTTISLPDDATVSGVTAQDSFVVTLTGSGTVTFAPTGSAILRAPSGLQLKAIGEKAIVAKSDVANVWDVSIIRQAETLQTREIVAATVLTAADIGSIVNCTAAANYNVTVPTGTIADGATIRVRKVDSASGIVTLVGNVVPGLTLPTQWKTYALVYSAQHSTWEPML